MDSPLGPALANIFMGSYKSKQLNEYNPHTPIFCLRYSPLGPVLVNIFMGSYKSKELNEYNLHNPQFCLRYVDHIVAAFGKEQDSLDFVNFLNDIHLNIKFAIEKRLTIPSCFVIYSFQILIIKISNMKHIRNQPVEDVSQILRVLHHFHIRIA